MGESGLLACIRHLYSPKLPKQIAASLKLMKIFNDDDDANLTQLKWARSYSNNTFVNKTVHVALHYVFFSPF